MLVAWWPLGLVLVAYGIAQLVNRGLRDHVSQGAPNSLGFGLHIIEPGVADRWMFGGLPTAWLQERLHPTPEARWFDALGGMVYVSHFVVIPLITAVLWFRYRARFRAWIGSVLVMTSLGIITYVVYPMAPPWLAAQLGTVDGVQRISGIGWQFLHLDPVGRLLGGSQAASNPVAAMPSLHAAGAALVGVFFWRGASRWARLLLISYPVLMALTVVYTGEHYVVDVLAGWAAALLAVAVCARRPTHSRSFGNVTSPAPAIVSDRDQT